MTSTCRKIVGRYIYRLVGEISDKIEEFRNHEPLDQFKSGEINSVSLTIKLI